MTVPQLISIFPLPILFFDEDSVDSSKRILSCPKQVRDWSILDENLFEKTKRPITNLFGATPNLFRGINTYLIEEQNWKRKNRDQLMYHHSLVRL